MNIVIKASFYLFIFLFQSLPSYGQGFSFYEYYSSDELNSSNPQNWTAIQDTNGYIIIGNGGGYLTYTGKSWSAGHIGETGRGNSFFVSSDGTLYANGPVDFGKIVPDSLNRVSYKSISSKHYSGNEYVPYIWEVYEMDGKIINRHNKGIIKYDPSTGVLEDFPVKDNYLWKSFRNRNEIIVDANDGLWSFRDSNYTLLPNLEEYRNERVIFAENLNSNETLIGFLKGRERSNEKSIFIFRDGEIKPFHTDLESYLTSNIAYKATVLQDGTITIATLSGGVVFLNEKGKLINIFTERNGLQTNEVYNLFEDHENQLWVMLSDGVQKLDLNQKIKNYNEIHKLKGVIEDIIVNDNSIWAVSESGLYQSQILKPENTLSFIRHENPDGIRLSGIFALDSNYYVYGDSGVFELSRNGIGDKMFDKQVYTHSIDQSSNRVILTGRTEIYEFNSSNISTQTFDTESSIVFSSYYQGALYFITSESDDVIKFQGDSLEQIQIKRDSSSRINFNHIGVIDNHLYLGTDGNGYNNGLFVLNEETNAFEKDSSFGINTPLHTKQVFKFQECSNGDVWFTADKKIIKATKEGNSWNLKSSPYKKISENAAYSYSCTEDGVWIGGIESLTFVDHDFEPDSNVFKTNITGVYVDRDSLIYGGYGEPEQAITLPFKDNELRFNYAAASYIDTEKNTYSVQLEGFENSWSSWSSETQKDYTNIPEGTYTFKVRSRNVYDYEGIPDEFTFTVLPPWYRTFWAYSLYVLFITGILYAAYKIRVNQILKVQRVRNRIADDLHDDLSGTLIGISNFAKAISKNPDENTQKRFIGLIEKSADEAKEKISDIVWTINPTHDDWIEFISKCRRHASDTLEAQGMDYQLDMDVAISGSMSMDFRKNIWLVFKEILTNITKHSEAEYVLISMKKENDKLVINIRDDGKGFEDDLKSGGNGIINIQKRVQSISGTANVTSSIGKGTHWKIVVPV